jgi:aminomethyltransferase
MNKTSFYDLHIELGAKMVDYAGYTMPIQYKKGILHEHKVVRESVGIFDVTHMGEFKVTGKDALALVQKITTNDASKLEKWDAQYSAMCYEDGGIVDDLLVYNMGSDGYWLVVNGANVQKDYEWVMKNTDGFDVNVDNQTNQIHLLAIQGPKSLDVLNPLTEIDMSLIPFYKFREGHLLNENMMISRTGYTGELGFELYFRGDAENAVRIFREILKAGEDYGIEPVGLGARDTLRLEKGYALYGNDIDHSTNPIEAGLGWITKLSKGRFNGSKAIQKVMEQKPNRRLVGFAVDSERFIARGGYKIYSDGKQIGTVTSGNQSPSLGYPVGMGYVGTEYKSPGTKIEIERKGKFFPAIIKKMPLL